MKYSTPVAPRCKPEANAHRGKGGGGTRVSKMLMLFLITAVLLEMAREINHLLLLSLHYGCSTMLQRVGDGMRGGGLGMGKGVGC